MSSFGSQLRKGVLEYCVLALLAGGPRYGFELVQLMKGAGGLLESEGTIYPLLGRMRKERVVETSWQESESGPPRRYYELTPDGRRRLEAFRSEWIRFRTAVDDILETGGAS